MCPSGTKSFVPERTKPPVFPGLAATSTPAASQRALSSRRASVARASPAAIRGSHACLLGVEPAWRTASPPRSTVEKNGPGMTARPISSSTTVRSTRPRPTPPCASG